MMIFKREEVIKRLLDYLDIPRFPYFHTVEQGIGPYDPEVFDKAYEIRKLNELTAIRKIDELTDEELFEILEDSIESFGRQCSLFDPLPWYAGGFGVKSHAADFDYWAKMDFWTLEESACLSIGFGPERILGAHPHRLSRFESINFYWDRTELIQRASFRDAAHPDRIKPSSFIAWAVGKNLEMPAELVSAVNQQTPSRRPAMLGSVDARLYESALKIVLGLLAQEYGYRGGTISTDIKRDVDSGLGELGLSIDRKTLTKVLNEVAKSLPELQEAQHRRDS